jgi:hypothetical protein
MERRIAAASAAGHQVFTARLGYRTAQFINPADTENTSIMLGRFPTEMTKREFHNTGWVVDCEMNSATFVAAL